MSTKIQTIFRARGRTLSTGTRGYSLLEILTVLGIISILMTIIAGQVTSDPGWGKLHSGIAKMAGFFEQARTYAVSNGTYVYLGWRNAGDGEDFSEFVLVASESGMDLSSMSVLSDVSDEIRQISRNLVTEHVNLSLDFEDDARLGAEFSPAVSDLQTNGQQIVLNGETFRTLLAFTPSGSVSFNGQIPGAVDVAMRHARKPGVFGVIQVAGFSGNSSVYLP